VPEQKLCANEGGRVGFIENRARLAHHHHARRMTVLRELWYCHVAVLSSTPAAPRILLDFRARTLFYPIFGGSFGGLLELKLGHAAYRRKALDVLFLTI
jgi:hypothetical protein